MDFHSVMETFAEAWVAANTQTPLTEAAAAEANQVTSNIVQGSNSVPSIAVKCIVERSSSCGQEGKASSDLDSGSTATGTPLVSSDRTSPTMSTVHQSSSGQVVEQNSFAIIPSSTPFVDIVRTALSRLGYSQTEAVGAKGFIQLRNWKPMAFDQITDSNEVTVSEILGDISSAVALRIKLFRPKGSSASNDTKEKLLQLLLAHSYSLLANADSPIDQRLVTALGGKASNARSQSSNAEFEVPEDTRKKLDNWYLQQVFNHYRQVATLAAAQQAQQQSVATGQSRRSTNGHPLPLSVDIESHLTSDRSVLLDTLNSSPSNHHHLGPVGHREPMQQFVRTRIRTSFDPELELPKLHKWFSDNQHPSRAQIQQYVKELNSLESRRGRKPLDVNNVVYWFKNARAAHKRQELKFINGGQSPPKNCSNVEPKGNKNSKVNGHEEEDSDDDDDSQYSHTLDLSVRPVKRQRRSSSNFGASDGQNGDQGVRVKEEEGQTDDGDDDSDLEDKFYFGGGQPVMPGGAAGHDFFTSGNGMNGNGMFGAFGASNRTGNSIHLHPESPEEADGRRIRRSRTFIDPMSEVPRLEQWFSVNTHPTHSQIVRYTEELNSLQYRQKFPKLEPKNIQFWFKNRRAKYKRLNLPSPLTGSVNSAPGNQHRPTPSPHNSSSSVTSSSPLGHLVPVSSSPTGGLGSGHSSPPPPTSSSVTSALNIERLIGH
ncbi:DNA-binding protein SATB2 [Halotydeus destructor]|nr:DNA-binding protein SATB2 [Halotydeus destructor]